MAGGHAGGDAGVRGRDNSSSASNGRGCPIEPTIAVHPTRTRARAGPRLGSGISGRRENFPEVLTRAGSRVAGPDLLHRTPSRAKPRPPPALHSTPRPGSSLGPPNFVFPLPRRPSTREEASSASTSQSRESFYDRQVRTEETDCPNSDGSDTEANECYKVSHAGPLQGGSLEGCHAEVNQLGHKMCRSIGSIC